MATKIQGVTLSIGGDTSPLSKALKDVNSVLSITQKELRDVEKALKLDPKNTEIMAQKQKLLADQLVATKEKSSRLNAVMIELEKRKGLGENVDDQIRAVQRELVNAESAIKSTESAVNKLDSSIETASQQTKLFGQDIKDASDKIVDFDDKIGNKLTKSIEGMGVAAAAGATLAIKSYVDFGSEMVKVKTLLDETVMSYDDAQKMVLDISSATGVASGELATAAYDALSAGVATEDLSNVLAAAAKTSVAGSTDAGTAMDVLTTIMNSYGIEADKVTQISDKLLMTQDKGKVTVGELSQGMGALVGISSEAGVSIDEVLAAVSALTMTGVPASTAINEVKSAISAIIKPSGEAREMAQDLGLKFNAQALEAKGLSGMLEDVKRKTGGNTEEMAKLFGSVEALNAMLVLTGKGSNDFSSSLNDITNASGNMDDAFVKIKEESGEKLKDAFNELANKAIEVGEALSPIVDLISSFILILAALDPQVIIAIGTLVMVAMVILQIVKVIKEMAKLSGPVGDFFGGFNTNALKTTAIIMGVVAVLIALSAIIAVIIGRGDELSRTMTNVSSSVGDMQNTVNGAGKNVPRYASGTSYHRGGGAIITEYGAEQLTLPGGAQYVVMPRGTRVDTAAQTKATLSKNQEHPMQIININVQGIKQLDEVVNWYTHRRQAARAAGGGVI